MAEETTIKELAERYGEENLVRFIYNRHCSRFDPHDTALDDALDIAGQYHTPEEDIVTDFVIVESYGDLAQYMRL